MANFRIEKDSLGEMRVPSDAYYGAQTARAVENFPVSGLVFPRQFLHALGVIKRSCAQANMALGDLDPRIGEAIEKASAEVADGRWDDQFVIDIFQTGSGTSTNMNANEVIANRAAEILGEKRGSKVIHPNDHVNMSQSSNDVIPTAIHVAAAVAISGDLLPALEHLHKALSAKAQEFDGVIKSGRTHLMDATPVRLGQEFGGYAAQIEKGRERVSKARDALLELALGGTAVGTGINRRPEFPAKAIANTSAHTRLRFREASNHFEAQGARDACIETSGALKTVACSLMKIANDIRLLGSGPRTGIAEISLPATQPGSSIMPAKVNPVMCEAVTMVAAQVIGNDAAITVCGMGGILELNVMMPVMGYDLFQSISILASVSRVFSDKCISGITANVDRCLELAERNLSIVTALAPKVGYDKAAEIAKKAHERNLSVREVIDDNELEVLLDLLKMTEPGM
jgi:fumarate hydratase class II